MLSLPQLKSLVETEDHGFSSWNNIFRPAFHRSPEAYRNVKVDVLATTPAWLCNVDKWPGSSLSNDEKLLDNCHMTLEVFGTGSCILLELVKFSVIRREKAKNAMDKKMVLDVSIYTLVRRKYDAVCILGAWLNERYMGIWAEVASVKQMGPQYRGCLTEEDCFLGHLGGELLIRFFRIRLPSVIANWFY